VGENFVTLLAGCGIIQLACLKSTCDSREAIIFSQDFVSDSISSIDAGLGVTKPPGCNPVGIN
jgi:hypothetical protein